MPYLSTALRMVFECRARILQEKFVRNKMIQNGNKNSYDDCSYVTSIYPRHYSFKIENIQIYWYMYHITVH